MTPGRKVLVLGLHHGALGIARSLGRCGVMVYGATDDLSTPVSRSRYLQRVFSWCVDLEEPARAVAELRAIGDRLERPLLLPTNDVATLLVEEHAEALLGSFDFRPRAPGLARALSSKRGMYELCVSHGIPTPRTLFPSSVDDVAAKLEELSFPVVVKVVDSLAGGASRLPRTTIAGNPEAAVASVRRLNGNALVQEYVPGGAESVWMFNGYFDERGDCLFGLTGRKLRQHPASGGITSLGLCVRNDTVHELTRRLMRAIGYHGILDCGFRFDARDGQYKLLDVNPRIGGTFRLFVDTAGLDVARVWYRDLTGQPVEPGQANDGRRWLVEDIDLVSASRNMLDRTIGLRDWLGSLRHVDETAWLAGDDLWPALWLPSCHLRARLRRRASGPARENSDT